MKKMLFGAMTLLFLTGTAMAQDKQKPKACCKKDATGKSACCKQPGNTASLRTKTAKPATANVQASQAAKPANKK
jgi:hypothetical protein